jgi:hypothetical protein
MYWLILLLMALLVTGRFWGGLLRKGIGEAICFAEGRGRVRRLADTVMDGGNPFAGELKIVLGTAAGKGTLAVFFTALLIVWPSALSWLVASVALTYAVVQFSRAYRQMNRRDLQSLGVTDDRSSDRTDVDLVVTGNSRVHDDP